MWRDPDAAGELLPECDGGPESDMVGDVFDRDVGGFEQFLGTLDAHAEDPLHGRVADLVLEVSSEAANAAAGVRGDVLEGEWFVEVGLEPVEGGAQAGRAARQARRT